MKPVTLTITCEGHKCDVRGPVNDKMLCYALLEMARDTIYEYHRRRREESRIVVPDLQMKNGAPNG